MPECERIAIACAASSPSWPVSPRSPGMSRSERLLKLFNGHMRALLTAKPRICMTIDSTYSWTCRNVKLPTASLSQMPRGRETPETRQDGDLPSSGIDDVLEELSPDLLDRWHGALFALDPRNPDAARHFCTSARELLTAILERYATDDDVSGTLTNCQLTDQGKPTRRSKIRFLLYRIGVLDDVLTDFVESDMENVVELFRVFNDGTHGSSGRFTHSQLQSIRVRVEDAVSSLGNIVSGQAFQSD